ncbi:MAG: hydrogenase maturation nickel metallochaperone HypA [Deltaproteobacteria bacterium]|nr:MAG: hydrogenase maturation nickel metallochaperone HypA [Deltaproteobacteria bacterium]
MHELSLVGAVVDEATRVLAREGASRVLSVRLLLGVLSCADRDALEICFPLAVRDTPLAGARLEVVPEPLTLRCAACGAEARTWDPILACGACQSGAVEVLGGRDLVIASLEVQ